MSTKKTILLVDDDAVLMDSLRASFRRRGYRVVSCQNASAAIAVAGEVSPDMAVVDLNLGKGPNGLWCVQALKAQQPELTVVLLTGYASVATAVEAIKFGACHYVCKPASVPDILAALGEATPSPLAEPEPAQVSVLRAEELKGIQEVMTLTGGNISEAARRLGLHRRSLQRKLKMLS
ncbi:response regulator [Asticcacaulis sp. MM231]|uniref:response regulator transcription factor n=1 Tax=Asticcacaulis sp. MM231 TaxID=3157666 RepID=UPI0032D56F91